MHASRVSSSAGWHGGGRSLRCQRLQYRSSDQLCYVMISLAKEVLYTQAAGTIYWRQPADTCQITGHTGCIIFELTSPKNMRANIQFSIQVRSQPCFHGMRHAREFNPHFHVFVRAVVSSKPTRPTLLITFWCSWQWTGVLIYDWRRIRQMLYVCFLHWCSAEWLSKLVLLSYLSSCQTCTHQLLNDLMWHDWPAKDLAGVASYTDLPEPFQKLLQTPFALEFKAPLKAKQEEDCVLVTWQNAKCTVLFAYIINGFKIMLQPRPTDATTKSQLEVLQRYPGNRFVHAYIMTIAATKKMGTTLLRTPG